MSESHTQTIHDMLNKAGFDDTAIATGITLRPTALQKVAARLGTSAKEVSMLITALVSRLRLDNPDDSGSVYEELVSEPDSSGNFTVRDKDSGRQSFVTGDASAQIRRRLARGRETEQEILADYSPVKKDVMREWIDSMIRPEGEVTEQPPFVGSIDTGIPFNFPWKIGHEHGTATAYATGYGQDMMFKIISVRDDEGDEFEATPELLEKLRVTARESIDDV